MGGIFGIFNFEREKAVDLSLLRSMGEVLKHRGPDGGDVYQNRNFGFGARWLNIGQLSNYQPVSNEDKTKFAVLDGEIYERSKWESFLKAKGHKLNSSSGAGILPHLYEEFGEGFVQKVRGEFAFAIWDEREQKLILGRDNAGCKPLYYFAQDDSLTFASEIKAILQDERYERRVSLDGLNCFLTYSYVPWPDTLFEGIKQVPPGHILVARPGKIELRSYWEFRYQHLKRQSEEYYAERLYELMEEAVRVRCEDLDSIGSYLSGGLDSSTLVGLLATVTGRQVKTFSVGFKEATHNELPDARVVSEYFGTEHHEIIVSYENVKDFLPQMIWHTDQPFFNSAAIATYYGAKLAREHVKVVFDAHGPDQLLAGFPSYHELLRQRLIRSPFPEWFRRGVLEKLFGGIDEDHGGFLKGLIKKLHRASIPFEQRVRMENAIFSEEEKQRLCLFDVGKLSSPFDFLEDFFDRVRDCDFLEKILYWEVLHMAHDDLMVKVDRMGMANFLETRIPFLDPKLMEFIGTIPSDLKLRGVLRKPVLKYIMKKSVSKLLPEYTLKKKKHGFSMPLNQWMMNNLRDFVCEVLLDSKTLNRGYFDKLFVRELVERFYKDRDVKYTQLWALMVFEMWNRIFMDKGLQDLSKNEMVP
ncbi:MAG: asparagine synthase (glutamine-hydrolyzing) [Thermoproteota archaeon]|nr:MAG: asparagine synthase (glutamine-hydrolyzing) [Candidatus Korarchaeota archaeon]